jgi:hypothetical protein
MLENIVVNSKVKCLTRQTAERNPTRSTIAGSRPTFLSRYPNMAGQQR